MRALSLLFAAGAAFLVGIAGTYFVMRQAEPPAAPATGADGKTVLYWFDPMKPDQHFDRPGKSPFMDMPLQPKYADAAESPGSVQIDPRLTQSLGLRTARAERGTLARHVRASGAIAFDERTITTVPSRVAGIVERLHVRAPLTSVKRGEPLATLLAPDWTAAQEDYLALRRTAGAGLDPLRAAARQRLVLLGMDDGAIRSIDRGGRAQVRFTLAAPRDGVVAELAVREGASVAAGMPLMTLNGLDTVWVNAAIAEADAANVAPGAAVTATLTAFPGETFRGTVETLLPDLDAATRTQRARIVLANPQHRLAPGMFAAVDIAASTAPAQILVPSEAVIATGTRHVVIVDAGGGHYRAQEVRVGGETGDRTAVLDGVAEGENVVLSGQFLIDSEASLAGALARLDGGASPPTAAQAPPAAAPEQRAATGRVVQIDGTHWSIAADAIASLDMGAMTMDFTVPANVPTGTIRSGQRVRFRFVRDAEGGFEIVELAKLDSPAKRGEP